MPPNHASLSSLLLPLLVTAAVWTSCKADTAPDVSQLQGEVLPEPSPSPAPSPEGQDPLRDPKVRRALIRALARSLQNLGGDMVEDQRVHGTSQPPHMVRFRATLGTRTTATFRTATEVPQSTTETSPLADTNFLPRSILEQVDKQFERAEFLRVHPDEVLVTSKTEPRPFSLKSFEDSLSTPTIDDGNSNSLSDEEVSTTTPPPTTEDNLRIEQHEIKSFVPTAVDDGGAQGQSLDESAKTDQEVSSKGPKTLESELNTVDIFRAPLIAAFTVHQDYETGATRGVVPLLPVTNQVSTSTPLSSSNSQGNVQNRLPPHFPLPNDELQDLVRQIATHPASSKSGRFPFTSQSGLQQQNSFSQQPQRLPEKQSLVYFHSSQQGIPHGIQQNFQFGSRPGVHQGLPQSLNSPNFPPVRGDFLTEQQQLQQRFQRIQTMQELQQLQARLERLQQQVQGG